MNNNTFAKLFEFADNGQVLVRIQFLDDEELWRVTLETMVNGIIVETGGNYDTLDEAQKSMDNISDEQALQYRIAIVESISRTENA